MFAAASNLLALIAFTVHAVFGCCVHHHHHAFEYACIAGDAPKSCCHDHGSESHDLEAEHNDCSDDENRSTDSPEAPCDGSHDCNEPSCSFIAASSNILTDHRVLSSTVICFGDTTTLSPMACVSYTKSSRHFDLAGPPASSSLRCAIAQSWQI